MKVGFEGVAIVLPEWCVEPLGDYPVKAMPTTYLIGYLADKERRFRAEQLRPIMRRFDQRCRDMEC